MPRVAQHRAHAALGLWRDRVSEALALFVLLFAPLPFGSVHDSFVALWCAVMALSLATGRVVDLSRSETLTIMGAVATMAVIALVAVLQIVLPHPSDPIWLSASGLLGENLGERPSASRLQPVIALGPMLLITAVFCRFLLLSRDPAAARRLLTITACAGLAYALLGLASFLIDPTSVLGQPKVAYRGNLTGPFVNRNNAATFFGTITIIWCLLLVATWRRTMRGAVNLRDRLWLLASVHGIGVLWPFIAFVICLAATAATGSRAGFALTLLFVALALLGIGRRRIRAGTVIVAGFCVGVVLLVAGGTVGSRVGLVGFVDGDRYEVYAASIRLLASRPWLGIGLGNFATVFPSIRPEALSVVNIWDRVHNTPLELALELGLPAFCLVAVVWLLLLTRLGLAAYRGGEIVPVAALMAVLLGTLHSLVDFPLQTPGYAVMFAAMAGMGLAHCKPAATGANGSRARP